MVGGTPSLGWGVPQSGLDGEGVPQPVLDGGRYSGQVWMVGGYPGQVWMVEGTQSTPQPGLYGGGVSRGPPPPPIRQSSITSTCYLVGGMPLAFTQEDFLFLSNCYCPRT